MDYGLQGKTVLVTAGSKGLGFATAKQFAAEGANVMISSRQELALQRAVEEIKEAHRGAKVHYFVADVSEAQAIESLFDAVKREFGGVDILINNAGGPPPGNFDSVTEEQWLMAHQLSLMSVIRATRQALPHMRSNQWGRIVNFTSSSVKQPIEGLILSNTYRTAVVGLGKSLALELGEDNILVNTLGPGRISTERVASLDKTRAEKLGISVNEVKSGMERQIPLGRYGTADEFAALAVFLGSPANGYITGQTILVDGGMVRSI
jgi:3-oxoacyl-[acyl-carrier protein] reductase